MILSPEQVADITRRWRRMLKSMRQRERRATPEGRAKRAGERRRRLAKPHARALMHRAQKRWRDNPENKPRVRRTWRRWYERQKIDPATWALIMSKARSNR